MPKGAVFFEITIITAAFFTSGVIRNVKCLAVIRRKLQLNISPIGIHLERESEWRPLAGKGGLPYNLQTRIIPLDQRAMTCNCSYVKSLHTASANQMKQDACLLSCLLHIKRQPRIQDWAHLQMTPSPQILRAGMAAKLHTNKSVALGSSGI